MKKTIDVLQDNESAILLEQNGILSSTQRTKHLNSRYFYFKDRVSNNKIATDKIVAEYLRNPRTGKKFYFCRLKMMNMKELKLETLRPKTPKRTNVSRVGKAERNIKKIIQTIDKLILVAVSLVLENGTEWITMHQDLRLLMLVDHLGRM